MRADATDSTSSAIIASCAKFEVNLTLEIAGIFL